ncbi:MAG: DegQ family serine endoprotease [Deltaproteobacteria bacterium]|nr:DegQ family serine endoprotease [Deltaproteobacteria bacterium]
MSSHARTSRTGSRIKRFAIAIGTGGALLAIADHRVGAISFWGEKTEETPKAESAPSSGAPSAAAAIAGLPDFARLAERLSPSVVNVSTTSAPEPRQLGRSPHGPGGPGGPPGEDPFHEFWEPFERFFGPMPRQPFKQRSLGSGFIINRDGVILTNNHVIENADDIVVKLSNDKEYKAKVVGRDAKTDIAVIRIEDGPELTPATLGDSDELRVGEWVMAIGNPFGLEHSVTAGIVSAKGRFIGQGSYDNFIQTDAAINPGNSGGPLINLKGEVVGINTAIFSRSGGNIGIGFATPINIAKDLLPELQEKGKVTRGWLGVLIQKVTPEIAESMELEESRGALVADVMKDGPAAAAGIKVGDVIIEFDGHPVKDSNELPLLVARTPIGRAVTVKLMRGKKSETVSVKVGELREEEVAAASKESPELGLAVQPLTPEIAENLGLGEDAKGVVVSGVEPGSPADDAGLRRGDVIVEINQKPVKDLASYRKGLESTGKGKSVLFLVRRGDNTIFLAVKPAK